jgi:hypothetical protein
MRRFLKRGHEPAQENGQRVDSFNYLIRHLAFRFTETGKVSCFCNAVLFTECHWKKLDIKSPLPENR